jgi:hypothetical protein
MFSDGNNLTMRREDQDDPAYDPPLFPNANARRMVAVGPPLFTNASARHIEDPPLFPNANTREVEDPPLFPNANATRMEPFLEQVDEYGVQWIQATAPRADSGGLEVLCDIGNKKSDASNRSVFSAVMGRLGNAVSGAMKTGGARPGHFLLCQEDGCDSPDLPQRRKGNKEESGKGIRDPDYKLTAPRGPFEIEEPLYIEAVLMAVSSPGGSPEGKLTKLINAFVSAAQRVERVNSDRRSYIFGMSEYPYDVRTAIQDEICNDAFLDTYDGRAFPIHSTEIVPYHEYSLALEVHSGGAYWTGMSLGSAEGMQYKVETLGLFAPSANEVATVAHREFGSFLESSSAQRGAAFVWRWRRLPSEGASSKCNTLGDFPRWLRKVLMADGADPIQKLRSEKEMVARWEQRIQRDTVELLKGTTELMDPFVRAVLKNWPSDTDGAGIAHLKRRAWVEGLDESKFAGKSVIAKRIPYDEDGHCVYELHASISRSTSSTKAAPPFLLTHGWRWAAPDGSCMEARQRDSMLEVEIRHMDIAKAIDALRSEQKSNSHPSPPTATPISAEALSPAPGRIDSLETDDELLGVCQEHDVVQSGTCEIGRELAPSEIGITKQLFLQERPDSMETQHDLHKSMATISVVGSEASGTRELRRSRNDASDQGAKLQQSSSEASGTQDDIRKDEARIVGSYPSLPHFRSSVLEAPGPNFRSAILDP